MKKSVTLQLAPATLRGWPQRMGDAPRDPLPQQALFLAGGWLRDAGEQGDLGAARALMIQFDGYLRPCEARQATANDIKVSPKSLRSAGYPLAAIMIAQT